MSSVTTNRRRFLQTGALGVGAAMIGPRVEPSLAAPAIAKNRPPNFLFVICDQLGLDAIGAHGCADVHTPNLDRMIHRGTTFIESHSTNPVCSPARSSLMTGRMPVETGVITNSRPIHSSCPTIGHVLGSAGYESIYCGKWHMPGGVPRPQDGFRVLPARGGQGDIDDTAISRTCEAYLKNRSKDQPYLMVASFLQPHDICYWGNHVGQRVPDGLPFEQIRDQLPELPPNNKSRPPAPAKLDRIKFDRFSEEQWRYYLYVYARMIEMLDADVGRVLDAVEASGEADNTVILFTSDHGDGRGRHMHVSKWYPYEEAVKVPMVVACPGQVAEDHRDTSHLVSGLDVMSTMCDYAGVKSPEDVRGSSLRPLLEQKNVTWRECVSSEHHVDGRMLRTEQYKFVHYEGDPVEQLFDMKADPWEMNNLYQDPKYATVLEDHRKLLAEFQSQLTPVEPTPSAVPPRRKRPKPKAKPVRKLRAKGGQA
ncbi:MAG: sulfatase-like hydrolase/transferase [Planctomycetes bacterium]|nr:sulfatase-like hydrolase/transferase [Planctomycetota bacterium]